MAIQQTYSMIKPDGVRNGHIGEIINRFERAGLTVERMELGMVTPELRQIMPSMRVSRSMMALLLTLHPARWLRWSFPAKVPLQSAVL